MNENAIDEVKKLEAEFWRSMAAHETEVAVSMLTEKALMTNSYGALIFDRAQYAKMANEGPAMVTDYKLGEIDALQPIADVIVLMYEAQATVRMRETGSETVTHSVNSSTWVNVQNSWKCVAHSDTPKR